MKHLLFPLLFCALLLASCSKPTITARHDIAACGVDDPLVNLPWLADVCAFSIANNYNTEITLYQLTDTTDGVYYFYIRYADRGKSIWWQTSAYHLVYNCDGDTVAQGVAGFDQGYDYFSCCIKKESLGEIWRYQR